MTDETAVAAQENVLGYARIEVDVRALIAAARPGDKVKIKAGEPWRDVPILAVEDDSWRHGLDP
jgi:hypothetical protein